MKKLMSVFESKRSIAGLFLLAGLVYTTYSIQENSNQIKHLTNFESGVQTCFTRVNQTFTANILGDKASHYLSQNFQNLTEECFAEGILSAEKSFKEELSSVGKKLSNLASNVHWFHEDILSPESTKGLVKSSEERDVGSRFEKIESTKDEILEATDKYKGDVVESLNKEKNIFYISATLLVILMLAEYMSLTRRRLSNSAREKEALAELTDNGGATSVRVGEIVRVALEQNELVNCSKLFANFYAHTLLEKGKNRGSLEYLITPIKATVIKEEAALKSNIDKIWFDDSLGLSADAVMDKQISQPTDDKMEDINLEQMSSNIVDLLAEKLFSKGIHFNANIAENVMIRGKSEVVEQILFHLFNYAITQTQSGSSEKNVTIASHKLGDVVAFDLTHSGNGFRDEILKQKAGLAKNNSVMDVDLQICQSLLSEIDAKIQFDNKISQKGNIVGGRVKIIFKTGRGINHTKGKLVDLKVGSKKEILATMANR